MEICEDVILRIVPSQYCMLPPRAKLAAQGQQPAYLKNPLVWSRQADPVAL